MYAELQGGRLGKLHVSIKQSFFEGSVQISRLISPPAIKAYTLLSKALPSGRLQLQLSLPAHGDGTTHPLLTIKLGETKIALLAGEAEVLQLSLIRVHASAPSAPSLPPLTTSSAADERVEPTAPMVDRADTKSSSTHSVSAGSPETSKPPPQRRLVVLYENHRRLTMLRPYSPQDLLPLDPAHFSDEAMKVESM